MGLQSESLRTASLYYPLIPRRIGGNFFPIPLDAIKLFPFPNECCDRPCHVFGKHEEFVSPHALRCLGVGIRSQAVTVGDLAQGGFHQGFERSVF